MSDRDMLVRRAAQLLLDACGPINGRLIASKDGVGEEGVTFANAQMVLAEALAFAQAGVTEGQDPQGLGERSE